MKTLLFVMGLVLITWAYADDKPVSTKAPTVTYERKTKIDFEDRDVDGEFLTPDGQSVSVDKSVSFDSMLDPKDNFKKELKRSMGAVR